MARANVYNQEGKKNKGLFYSIIAGVGLLIVAGIVCLILWATGVFNSKDKYQDAFENSEYKTSYKFLEKQLSKGENVDWENIFVFVYNSKEYGYEGYVKKDEDDNVVKSDYELTYEKVNALIQAIEEKDETHPNLFKFYIIDVAVEDNYRILQDSKYGFAANTEDDTTLEGAQTNLLYFYQTSFMTSAPEAEKDNLETNYKDFELGGLKNTDKEVKRITAVLNSATNYVKELRNN